MDIKTVIIPSYGVYYPVEEVVALKEDNKFLIEQVNQMQEKINILESKLESKQKKYCLIKL